MTSNINIKKPSQSGLPSGYFAGGFAWLLFFSILMIVAGHAALAQTQRSSVQIQLIAKDSVPASTRDVFARLERRSFRSQKSAMEVLDALPRQLHQTGHLLASLDSVWFIGDTLFAEVFSGSQLAASVLVMSDSDMVLAQILGVPVQKTPPLQPAGITISALLDALLQQGYPLASVYVDNMALVGDTMFTYVSVEPGRYHVWDSVAITGDVDIDNRVMQRLLRIRKDRPYDNRMIMELGKNMATLPFLNFSQGYSVVLTSDGKARVILPLQKVKASSFNGLIGFGPDRIDPTRLILSGDVALKLHNALGYAEEMELKWVGIQGDQNLYLFYRQPYLPFAPFGVMGRFELFRRGETYYTLLQRAGLVVRPAPESLFTVWFQRKGSKVLDRSIFTTATTLPPFADYEATLFGITWQRQALDHPVNPGSGYRFYGELGGGARRLLMSNDIPEGLFEGVQTSTRHASAEMMVSAYLPLTERWIIRPAINLATLYGGVQHENGLFFIGGIHTIRGFDERSITASSHVLGSLEVRYRFEQMAHFKLFIDGGWYQKALADSTFSDTPYGFGAGINLPSPAGIIQVSYGWGIGFGNPFDVRSGRLHIGVEARF